MQRTHPETWRASSSGLGGPLVATHEFGAWHSPAKIHTRVTLSQERGKVLGRGPFLRRRLVIPAGWAPVVAIVELPICSTTLSAWNQASRRPAADQLLA